MLQVGNGNLTIEEEKTHFALWALVKAPLLLGMDLTTITKTTRDIISNRNLISIHQDPGASPASCFVGCNDSLSWSVYATRITGGDTVAIIANWKDTELGLISFGAHDVGVVPRPDERVTVVDLWTNKVIGRFDFEELKTLPIPKIQPHGSVLYRLMARHESQNGPLPAATLRESLMQD